MAAVNRYGSAEAERNVANLTGFYPRQLSSMEEEIQRERARRLARTQNYGMASSNFVAQINTPAAQMATPLPPESRPVAPPPPEFTVLLDTPDIKFQCNEKGVNPSFDRIYTHPLWVKGVAWQQARAFKLFELPDCCATVVASGFGFLHAGSMTDAFVKGLPALAAKFGYTQVLFSTTEAASVPKDSPFQVISECVNSRTNNTVTIFSAPTGLTYTDLHSRRSEEDDD